MSAGSSTAQTKPSRILVPDPVLLPAENEANSSFADTTLSENALHPYSPTLPEQSDFHNTSQYQLDQTHAPLHSHPLYGLSYASGIPLTPRTPLELGVSHDKQEIEMNAGYATRKPTPKVHGHLHIPGNLERTQSPVQSLTYRSSKSEVERVVPQNLSFVSPSTTLDANLVGWDGPNDHKNPQNWSVRYKWLLTLFCSILTISVSFASSAPSSAALEVMQEFGVDSEVASLMTTSFLLGYVFGPLVWGPGSELVGRRPVFIIASVSFVALHLGQILAQNIQTLLITRFLCGFFAVAPLTNCGGLIADIWPAAGRGPATALFAASGFSGSALGPVISGYIVESPIGWRWVFGVMMCFAGGCMLLTIPFLPETYAPVILAMKVKRLRKIDPVGTKDLYAEHEKQDWSFRGVISRTLFRPFSMLAVEPILLLITIYISITFGLLYGLLQAIPIIFIQRRGFTIAQNGLIFIGIGIGSTIGTFISFYNSAKYTKLIVNWRGYPPPEYRLFDAMVGAPCLVIGIFWMGWTGEYASVPWYVPALSTIIIGVGINLIFTSFSSYLGDTYLTYSASALAANVICRSAVAAAFPLFTVQMFTAVGVNWACTIIGIVGLVFLPSPFLFYKYGSKIREKSGFAPCIDLKIRDEIEKEERDRVKEEA